MLAAGLLSTVALDQAAVADIQVRYLHDGDPRPSVSQYSSLPLCADRLCVCFVPRSLQTVAPQQMLQMAKPMAKPQVDKGRVWVVFVGGAALLFGSTLVLEDRSGWFPAISKANTYLRMRTKQLEVSPPGRMQTLCMSSCSSQCCMACIVRG